MHCATSARERPVHLPRFERVALPAVAALAITLCSVAVRAQGNSQVVPLPALGADLEATSVSGLSSGAFMASQFHIAHSRIVIGAGIVAGGPYACAENAYPRALEGAGRKHRPSVRGRRVHVPYCAWRAQHRVPRGTHRHPRGRGPHRSGIRARRARACTCSAAPRITWSCRPWSRPPGSSMRISACANFGTGRSRPATVSSPRPRASLAARRNRPMSTTANTTRPAICSTTSTARSSRGARHPRASSSCSTRAHSRKAWPPRPVSMR